MLVESCGGPGEIAFAAGLNGFHEDIGNAFGGRGRYVDVVSAIFLRCCADVPAVDAVTGPGAADDQGFMD